MTAARTKAPPRTVRVDGATRRYPTLHPCVTCGRAPVLTTSHADESGEPTDPDGGGPYYVRCDHGETPLHAKMRHAREERAILRGDARPPRIDTSTPGVLRFVMESGPRLYRSWHFPRAVDGWNASNPRLRALTILQPSAQAILAGVKPWENRGAPPPSTVRVGEWIALHAGVALWPEAARIRALWPECPPDDALPRGAILGAWRYDGAEAPDGSAWAFGPTCLRVGAVVRLPAPIPCPDGHHQGYWFVPGTLAVRVREAIAEADVPPALAVVP